MLLLVQAFLPGYNLVPIYVFELLCYTTTFVVKVFVIFGSIDVDAL